jgi:hypothetical protein
VLVQETASTWDGTTGTIGLNTNDVPGEGGVTGYFATNTITPAGLYMANNTTATITMASGPNLRLDLTNAIQTVRWSTEFTDSAIEHSEKICITGTNSIAFLQPQGTAISTASLTLSATSTVTVIFRKEPGETNIYLMGTLR